jgi:CRISPR-associated protein Csm1
MYFNINLTIQPICYGVSQYKAMPTPVTWIFCAMPASYTNAADLSLQSAVQLLAAWANSKNVLSPEAQSFETPIIQKAKVLNNWPASESVQPLRLVFDRVSSQPVQPTNHYWPAIALSEQTLTFPYPTTALPDLNPLKAEIAQALNAFSLQDWQNPSLMLATLEKFGSHVSLDGGDISLYDQAKTCGAIASALADDPQAKTLCLIAGDLSGIQDFIYTIAAAGALRSLRARSFYLQLVTEEIVHRLLQALSLPRTSIIYAGGGNLYILAPANAATTQAVEKVQKAVNDWLLKDFQGKVFLALTTLEFPTKDVQGQAFATRWEEAIQKLAKQKNQKFSAQLSRLFAVKATFENCKVCHRDDTSELKPLNRKEPDSPAACCTCRNLFELGGKLPKTKAIVRSTHKELPSSQYALPFYFSDTEIIYYHCFDSPADIPNEEPTWLINSWELKHYRKKEVRSLLMGNYYAPSVSESKHDTAFIQAEELATASTGIERVGYLRMDVDNLGRMFAKGLGEHHNLPRLSALSRQTNLFFSLYLNYLAEKRDRNLPAQATKLSNQQRLELLFIYAGGDDLFISGAWNQVIQVFIQRLRFLVASVWVRQSIRYIRQQAMPKKQKKPPKEMEETALACLEKSLNGVLGWVKKRLALY